VKASVDQETCIGCGICVNLCPGVFEFNEKGLAFAKAEAVPEVSIECAGTASEQCPVNAIEIKV
jgi:ferredoxin